MTDTTERTQKELIVKLWKDVVSTLRDTLLLILGVLLIAFPSQFNTILVEAGFEEGSVVGFKWKSSLVKTDQALKDIRANNTDLIKQNQRLSQALKLAETQLDDKKEKKKIEKILLDNHNLKLASETIEKNVNQTITSNAKLVEKAELSIGNTFEWGVVYGGDTSLESANYETGTVAIKYDISNAEIYFRQNSYRSVALAISRQQAEQILLNAKKRRSDAYIVDMDKWCPKSIAKKGYFECL